jgi:AcrR family transcriptional regulator
VILDRAVDLASIEGLEGLTIGRLASDLGMSKSGLFRHFGSKLDLQLATVGAARDRFVAMVLEPASAAPDGAPRLRAMASRYFDYIESFPGGCFWGATMSEYDDRPGPVRDAIAASMEAWMGELVRQSKAAGIADPERYAFELYAVVMAANARHRLSGDRRAFDLARAALARLESELPA